MKKIQTYFCCWLAIMLLTTANTYSQCSTATALAVLPQGSTACTQISNNGVPDATDPTAPTCWGLGGAPEPTIDNPSWFSVVAPANGNLFISTDFAGSVGDGTGTGGMGDTQIAVYSGSCGSLTEVGCDDDSGVIPESQGTGTGSWLSIVNLTGLTAGATYYVMVDGWDGSAGSFCIIATDVNCGDGACGAGEDYATCPGDCPCETTINYLSWPDFAASTTPLIYCPAQLTDAGLGYNGGPNENPPVGYIPFVVNSSIELTLADPNAPFGTATVTAGSLYNSTSPPSANATGEINRFIKFIKLTQADVDAGSVTLTFTGNNGDTDCNEVFIIDLSSLSTVNLATQCPLFTCGANGCETASGEDYCTCPGDCTCTLSGSFNSLDAQGFLVNTVYPFGFCSTLFTSGATPGNAYYLITAENVPSCVTDVTVTSTVGVIGDHDAGVFIPGINQIGATSQNGFLVLELTQAQIDAVIAGADFNVTLSADGGACVGTLTFTTAAMPADEIAFITDLNTSCAPPCLSSWTSVTTDPGACVGDDLVFTISGLNLDASQSIALALITNAAGTGFSDLATEGFADFADAWNATAFPYAISFEDLSLPYVVDAAAGTVTVPGGLITRQCTAFNRTIYLAIIDGVPADYDATVSCQEFEYIYTVRPGQPDVIETAGNCTTAATLTIGYDNGDGANGAADGDFDDPEDRICGTQTSAIPTPICAPGNATETVTGYTAADLGTLLGGGATCYTAIVPTLNASCPNISQTDPGTCDDGVCSNGVETWNAATCACVAGTPPVPCVSDGNCTNGVETWDATTCTCNNVASVLGCTNATATNYNPLATCDDGSCTFTCPDPGTCNDGVCSNGVETWNAAICDCVAGTPPVPCVSDGNCTNGVETWDAATCTCNNVASVLGCTNATATNYNPLATCDDGSCTFTCPDPENCSDGVCSNGVETWDAATCACVAGTPPVPCVSDGNCMNGVETWNAATCVCVAGTPPVPCVSDGNCTNGVETWDSATCTCNNVASVLGCTNATATNYNPLATCDDGSCTFTCPDPENCSDGVCSNGVETWNGTTCECQAGTAPTPCVSDGNCTNGVETWDATTCTCNNVASVLGCTNPLATNYNADATCDDGSCILGTDCDMNTAGIQSPGSSCDDGDADTTNDMYSASCVCAGTIPGTPDCVGVINGPAQPGTACNDNNNFTVNDTWSANCTCAGSYLSLSAASITTNAGATSYTVSFTVSGGNGVYAANGGTFSGSTFTSNPIECGTDYNFTVTDGSGQTPIVVSGASACTVDPCASLEVSELDFECDGATTQFIFTYQLSGGTAPYTVVGDYNGTDLPEGATIEIHGVDGSNFSFTVTDSDDCTLTVNEVSVQCIKCEYGVEMDVTEEIVCPGGSVTADYTFTDPNNDFPATGTIAFAIHTGSGSDVGTILALNTTGTFNFASIPGAVYGTTYYLSALAGEDADGDGIPDLDNNCLKVAVGTAVEFIAPIQITAVPLACDEQAGSQPYNYTITGGIPPYDVTGDVNGSYAQGQTFTVNYDDGDIPSIDVLDTSGCPPVHYVSDAIICIKTDISLTSFTGQATEAGNVLHWITASEYQNDFFTLERSKDGVSFERIASIDGAGSSSAAHSYTYTDGQAPCELTYYRLSQTDFDGSVTVVNHLVSLRNTNFCQSVEISPIPASISINVSYITAVSGYLVMNVYDVVGKQIASHKAAVSAGSNMLPINISELANGVYFLSVTQNGNTINHKFVKN